MLRPGLPPARPDKFMTSDMCIPVFPNTDHPSRAPLQPVSAIPWVNAYHAAFDHVILRVRAALADKTLATVLSKSERMHLTLACARDNERRRDSIEETSAYTGPTYGVYVISETEEGSVECDVTQSSSDTDDGPTSSASASSGAEEDSIEREVIQGPPDTTPLVYMSYDLTGVQELCDPQDFFREIEAVQQ